MNTRSLMLASVAIVVLSAGSALAGPCDSRSASAKDAGSGPTVGSAGQTTAGKSTDANQHPPTNTMNRATGEVATSSQDAQKQMQGQPTAAQQAEGAKPTGKTGENGC